MGKIVNGVANDYDCEQYEEWNKHLKYCQSNDPIILTRWQDPTIEELQKEIARLKNAINKITSIMNEYDFSYNDEWYEEPTSQELSDDYYAQSYIDIHRVYLILQEIKEEGK